jgi:CheY-like chemotaxis protein
MLAQSVQTDDRSTYRILIVDDNEAIHRDFRSLLQSKSRHEDLRDLALAVFGEEAGSEPNQELPDYAFDSAYQGRAALETVKEARSSGRCYAVAFVDVRMPPGWDGVETIQRLWEVDPNLHVIICSAYSDYTWDDLVEKLGATDKLLYLRKPFDPTCVKQMALAVARKWRLERVSEERIAELEAQVSQRDQELASARAELEKLEAELGGLMSVPVAKRREQIEQAERLEQRVSELIAALEQLAGAALGDEHSEQVDRAMAAARDLGARIEWVGHLIRGRESH